MIEQVINRRNMHLAYKQVLANKGSAGVDGMRVSELKPHIRKEREAIVLSIINGRYLPQPILGVSHSKEQRQNPFAWYSNGNRQVVAASSCTNHHTIVRV